MGLVMSNSARGMWITLLLAALAGCSNSQTSDISYPRPTLSVTDASGRQSSLTRTTCPEDDVVGGSCLRFLHEQPLEFWEQYQREAPALREGFLACHELRNQFGDWVRNKREDLRMKDRQWNMDRGGYLPHSVVEESSYVIQQMANSFIVTEYNQIINRGARPELCQERIAYWKAQILSVTEKFPPLRGSLQHDGDGWRRPQ